MKKIIKLILCCIIVFSLTSCNTKTVENRKEQAEEYLDENYEVLSEKAEEKLTEGESDGMDYFNKADIFFTEIDGRQFVVFDFVVPMLSDTWSGLYYSPDDIPMNRSLISFDLEESRDGWYYKENNDVSYYTERLSEGWFFFYIGKYAEYYDGAMTEKAV